MTWKGSSWSRMTESSPPLEHFGHGVKVGVGAGCEDVDQGVTFDAAVVSGCPSVRRGLVDQSHDVGPPADGAAGQSTADGLGQADQVGGDVEALGGTAGSDGDPGLDLVEDEHRAVLVGDLFDARKVAGVGQDDAAVHHRGLHDHSCDLFGMTGKHGAQGVEVVEGHFRRQLYDGVGYALALRHRGGRFSWAHLRGVGLDRHHEGVVVALVGGLDLDQPVASELGFFRRARAACARARYCYVGHQVFTS